MDIAGVRLLKCTDNADGDYTNSMASAGKPRTSTPPWDLRSPMVFSSRSFVRGLSDAGMFP